MTAIEHLDDNPPLRVIERAATLVRKRHQTGRLNSYFVFPLFFRTLLRVEVVMSIVPLHDRLRSRSALRIARRQHPKREKQMLEIKAPSNR
jgi:hypothetical protein